MSEDQILDAIPHSAAASSQTTGQTCADARRRQNFIQCRQCSEQFAKRTVSCPRCNRVNDRSPVIRGLKFLALVLCICTVKWVVRVAASFGEPSAVDHMTLPPVSVPTFTSQPDLRY